MAYIYKITNIITKHSYIGYTSRNPAVRFYEHYHGRFSEGCNCLNRAMIKYPLECFQLTILEEIEEKDWVEREQFWIDKYNTIAPNGYNLNKGGEKPPAHYGENNNKSKITDAQSEQLLLDLINYNGTYPELSKKYGLTVDHIRRINNGTCRHKDGLDYPLRKYRLSDYVGSLIIQDLKEDILTQEEMELKYQIKSRTRLYDINNGLVLKELFPQDHYPLRKNIINRVPIYLQNPVETIPVIGK